MRRVCRQFRHFGEARCRSRRILDCIEGGEFCAQLAVTGDDLETYQLIEDIAGTSAERSLAQAVYRQSSRCLEYIWPKVNHPSDFVDNYLNDIRFYRTSCIEQKMKRNPVFDQQILRRMIGTGYKINNLFLYYLNCPTDVKIELLKAFDDAAKRKYLEECIINVDELKVVEYLLESDILVNIRKLVITAENGNPPHSYEEMRALLARFGYIIPEIRMYTPHFHSGFVELKISEIPRMFPQIARDPRMMEWLTFLETSFSRSDQIKKLWDLFSDRREVLHPKLKKFLPFCLVPEASELDEVLSLLTTGRCSATALPKLFNSYRHDMGDPSLSFFRVMWNAGGREYIKKELENDAWDFDDDVWECLYLTGLPISVTFDSMRRLVEWYRRDDTRQYILFSVIRCIASTPRLLEMLIELDVDYVWLYLAYWNGASSFDLSNEAKRVQNEKLLLFQAGILDYDGSVLSYLRHRCSMSRLCRDSERSSDNSIGKSKDPRQIAMKRLFGKSFPVA